MDYTDILLASSSPVDLRPPLNLSAEIADLENLIRNTPLPIRSRRLFPPTLEEFRSELLPDSPTGRRPKFLHFLGHGEEDGLWFENEFAGKVLVPTAKVVSLVGGSPVDVALINACWSAGSRVASLVQRLVDDGAVQAAIGHEQPVEDRAALMFARFFYEEFFQGQPIYAACQRAANRTAEAGFPDAAQIEFFGNREVTLFDSQPDGAAHGVVDSGMPVRGSALPGAGVLFFGRDTEFLQAAETLADPSHCAFAIWGIGGIGKTRLALEIARRSAWRYRAGGLVFVDARDLPAPTLDHLLAAAVAGLIPGVVVPDARNQLLTYLSQGAALVVADNLESLPADEQAKLARFVGQVPRNGSRFLLTARVAIPEIERLPDVRCIGLARGLDDWSGAHYLHRLAVTKEVTALLDPPRFNAGRVEGACAKTSRRLSGHPRMLEVAVGIARRGSDKLDSALDGLSGDLESQLQEILSTGLGYVGEEGHGLMRLLRLFPSGRFMPEEILAAARGSGLVQTESEPNEGDPHEDIEDDTSTRDDIRIYVERGLRQLEDAVFISFVERSDTFQFHPTLQDYVRINADENPDVGQSVGKMLKFYREYVAANGQNDAAIDRCFGNLAALVNALIESDQVGSHVARLGASLFDYLEQRGQYSLAMDWNDHALETLDEETDAGQIASLCYRQAVLYHHQGNPTEARRLLQRSMQLKEELGDQRGLSASLHVLAMIEDGQGNPTEARRLLQRSSKIFEELGDQRGLSGSLHQLAIIEHGQGNPTEARRLLQRSMKIKEELGDQRGLSASLHVLAIIEDGQGNPTEARRLLQRASRIDEELGDQRGLSASLHQLAIIEHGQGNPTEARRLLQRSSKIVEELGDQRGLSASLHQLAIIEHGQGNPTEARRLLQRSSKILEELGDQRGIATSALMLAQLEAAEGNQSTAIEMASEAVTILERTGSGDLEMAKQILAAVSGAGASPGVAKELSDLVQQFSTSASALADLDAMMSEDSIPLRRSILLLLTKSAVALRGGDRPLAEECVSHAQKLAADLADGDDLRQLVAALQEQLRDATTSPAPTRAQQLLSQALKTVNDDPNGSLTLLREYVELARSDQDAAGEAVGVLYVVQVLMKLNRLAEAATEVRPGLVLAEQIGDDDSLKAYRQTASALAQQMELQQELERPLDEILAQATTDDQKAQILLRRAQAVGQSDPEQALSFAEQALEYQAARPELKVVSHRIQAQLMGQRGKQTSAAEQLKLALDLAEAHSLKEAKEIYAELQALKK